MPHRKTVIQTLALLFGAYLSMGSSYSCSFAPWRTPSQGSHTLNVTFHQQVDPDYCVPASVLMWLDYVSPLSFDNSYEHQIWNYGAAAGWAHHGAGGGVDTNGIAPLTQHFLGYPVSRQVYPISEIKRAVADQEKGIDNGNPTLVEVNFGIHAVLFVGASWQELPTAQPSQDYVVVHDPDYFLARPNERVTLDYWMNYKGRSCGGGCVAQTMRDNRYFAAAEHEEFERAGGTYYGDPTPPPPPGRWKDDGNGGCYWDPNDSGPDQCQPATGRWKDDGNGGCYWDPNDSGPDQCVPSRANLSVNRPNPLTFVLRAVSAVWRPSPSPARSALRDSPIRYSARTVTPEFARKHFSARKDSGNVSQRRRTEAVKRNPPYPQGRSRQEILANIDYGVKQMRMNDVPGLEPLGGLLQGTLAVRRILDVESELTPDYYVVELDMPTGGAFADILLSKTGIVWSVSDVRKGRQTSAPDLAEVTDRLTKRFGESHSRYYHAGNNLNGPSGSQYLPLILAETPGGRLFVTANRDVYMEESFQPYVLSREEETSNIARQRPNQKWLIKRGGVGTLRKLGTL